MIRYKYIYTDICNVLQYLLYSRCFFLEFTVQHILSAQEPNLSYEGCTQSIAAVLSFLGFYFISPLLSRFLFLSLFIAGEGIRLFLFLGKCLRSYHNLLPGNDIVSKPEHVVRTQGDSI